MWWDWQLLYQDYNYNESWDAAEVIDFSELLD